MRQRFAVGFALAALVGGTMLAANGTRAMLMVALVFVGLALALVSVMAWVER